MVSIWLMARRIGGSASMVAAASRSGRERLNERRRLILERRDDCGVAERLLAILLDTGRAEPGEPVAVDRILPGEEFLDGQRVSAAGFFEREQAAANRRNDFRLATNHPALGSGRGEIGDRQRTSVGPDDILYPRAVGFGHVTLTHSETDIARPTVGNVLCAA